MKNIFKLMALCAILLLMPSCKDDGPEAEKSLEVTGANLHGTWKLSEWCLEPLAEGTYCYITFNRRDLSFEMYQNFDSMRARRITGKIKITHDPRRGDVISGKYDYDNGPWNHEYIVSELLESGSMTWIADDDASDVSLYTHCDKVPDEIVVEAGKEED